ncbi:hypothetical protein OCGS_0526 [Oceaniovalibus guishaninsula JLT2003]|uniref:Glyoxalase-like domain-containing protein n=1 Tax=Oceaniovalibus guishaninsula JLT2003 TaxID=1231392 RepID=K2GS25_9RHOB|nr:VOC family protein [Oceaniovalibus guishaninsula]EKE45436.1 hypothetical protein OCGS_0526 [Oceaniovalibus guishaninsula JLT2003]
MTAGAALRLDHLVVTAATVAEGAERVAAALGVRPGPGGRHAAMGTHNLLLSLGPACYLEVIAVDPDAPDPGRARWFDLDRHSGAPALTNWVAACDDLDAALEHAPPGIGVPMDLARGDLRWRMAVPRDGCLPLDGAAPGLIAWRGRGAASILPDTGLRLTGLTVGHPRIDALLEDWPALRGLAQVVFSRGSVGLSAEIATLGGRRLLT